ncbi:MAG: hypothetical protein QM763_00620 [Agriterribacter sp.]
MRNTLTLISILFTFNASHAQKTEFNASLNSGLFSFRGESASKSSIFFIATGAENHYTNNPYGSKNGLSYGISAGIKRPAKNNLLIGLDAGYEMLRSKIIIDGISLSTYSSSIVQATGHTYLNSSFINLFPYGGYRFSCRNNFYIDLTGGFDLGFCTNSREKSTATDPNGKKYEFSINRKTINTDIRTRIQITAHYKMIGIYAGYSAGLVNYKSGYVGGVNEAYSRMLRFGTTFTIK